MWPRYGQHVVVCHTGFCRFQPLILHPSSFLLHPAPPHACGKFVYICTRQGIRCPFVDAPVHPHAHAENGTCHSEIAKALQGNYKAEHLFVLKQSLAQYDFYLRQIQECDAEMETTYADLPPAEADEEACPPPKPKRGKPRKNQAHFDLASSLYQMAGVDLTAIDGLDALTVQFILTVTGVDMSPWLTVKHFASWLCLSPFNDKSGGKVLRTGSKKTQNRANTAFRLAAQSVSRSNSALGAFYRRMRAKHGPAKANKATAHKLTRIVYHMLKNRTAYADPGQDYYEEQYQERTLRNLKRKAAKLGMELMPKPTQAPVVS